VIECISPDSSLMSVSKKIDADSTIVLTADTAKAWGSVRGAAAFVVPAGARLCVAVVGTPYETVVAGDRSFELNRIPPGPYAILALIRSETGAGPVAVSEQQVDIVPDTAVYLDTVKLKSFAPAGSTVTVDNFDDGDYWNMTGGFWWGYDDRMTGGTSIMRPNGSSDSLIAAPGYGGSVYCMHGAFTLGTGPGWPYAGLGTQIAGVARGLPYCVDLSSAKGIRFNLRGSGGPLWAELVSDVGGNRERLAIDSIPSAWTQFTIDFSICELSSESDTTSMQSWRQFTRFSSELRFASSAPLAGESGEIFIDDIEISY
jgi:hypothetical protein